MFTANLASVKERLGLSSQDVYQTPPSAMMTGLQQLAAPIYPGSRIESASRIKVGVRSFVFPARARYEKYVDFFFHDINPCHSCVNEADFRDKARRVLGGDNVEKKEVCFLALNYIIFACSDILLNVASVSERGVLPGWKWFLAADELVGKRKLSGRGDLSLIQFLVYEVIHSL